jgi:hypothetical protein
MLGSQSSEGTRSYFADYAAGPRRPRHQIESLPAAVHQSGYAQVFDRRHQNGKETPDVGYVTDGQVI